MNKLLDYKYFKIILGVLAIILALLSFWFLKGRENKKIAKADDIVVANTNEGVIKEEEFNGLKVSNISLITEKGYTTFNADVTNTNSEETNFENININLLDKDGNVVITLLGNIGTGLKANETRTITASAKGEFKNVTSKAIVSYKG